MHVNAPCVLVILVNFMLAIPDAKDQDPARFFDARFVRRLESSGFIDSLYR
jgi:hypothetical protein